MSPYKDVNGKKVRDCKYECGLELSWSETAGIFVESDGTLHTQERCKAVKASNKQDIQGQKIPTKQNNNNEISLEVLIKKLASIGITIDLEKLRNAQ